MKGSLKWCVLASIPVVLLALAPQARLLLARGFQWEGAYATVDGDEFLYSAYINALIDGRPRRNDPFSGRDHHPNAPLPESAFSIQFLPPFLISSFGKILGLSASTCFIFLMAFSALSAAVTIFWLFSLLLKEYRIAAYGTLFVLFLGTAAAGEGLLGALFTQDVSRLGLAFLRRYQPAAPFFLFFAFGALVHCALTSPGRTRRRLFATLSGLTLGALIFSYLYLWTTAAVWVVILASLWLYFRPPEGRQTIEVLSLIAVMTTLALAPYIYLLSNRAQNLDETQTLISTHRPDPFRVPEILGLILVVLTLAAVKRKRIELRDPSIILAMSFAVLPFILFNQQVISGRSMQPFHFQHFVVNYALLISFVILTTNRLKFVSSRRLAAMACVIVAWGVAEVAVPTEIRIASDVKNDQIVPALLRLKALSEIDGTASDLGRQGKTSTLVFSPELDVLLLLPTWTSQGVMPGIGGLDFASAAPQDRKVFAYLYFSGVDTARLRELILGKSTDSALNYYVRAALFGHERILPQLSLHRRPVQDSEIQEQLCAYENYVSSFGREEVVKQPLTYVVVLAESAFDPSRIDLWYERGPAERVGRYLLYRVRLRSP